eukprot:142170_1
MNHSINNLLWITLFTVLYISSVNGIEQPNATTYPTYPTSNSSIAPTAVLAPASNTSIAPTSLPTSPPAAATTYPTFPTSNPSIASTSLSTSNPSIAPTSLPTFPTFPPVVVTCCDNTTQFFEMCGDLCASFLSEVSCCVSGCVWDETCANEAQDICESLYSARSNNKNQDNHSWIYDVEHDTEYVVW